MSSSQARRSKMRERREARNRRRLLMLIAGVAVVGALSLIVLNLQQQARAVTLVERPYAHDKTLGPDNAPVTVEEYADFQCPFCAQFATGTARQLEDTYFKSGSGKVRFVFHPVAFLGPESQDAAEAAECANEQGKFWDYYDILFTNQRGENQGGFSLSRLKSLATGIPGLDTARFNTCLDSHRYRQTVQQETQQAQDRGIKATPTIVVNGQMVEGAIGFDLLNQMIERSGGGG